MVALLRLVLAASRRVGYPHIWKLVCWHESFDTFFDNGAHLNMFYRIGFRGRCYRYGKFFFWLHCVLAALFLHVPQKPECLVKNIFTVILFASF